MGNALNAQFDGEIGPFLDTVQQRQVSVVVSASCKFVSMMSPVNSVQHAAQVQAEMLRAIREAIAPRMASGQLAFKDLITNNTAAIIPEILARSGLAQAGVAVDKLVMRFGIDGHPPPALPSSGQGGASQGVAATQASAVAPVPAAAPAAGGATTPAPAVAMAPSPAGAAMPTPAGAAKPKSRGLLVGIVVVVLLAVVGGGYVVLAHRGSSAASSPAAKTDTKTDSKGAHKK